MSEPAGTMPGSRPCPCGGDLATEVQVARGLTLLRCRRCRLLARPEMPSVQALHQWYRDQYWVRYESEQTGAARGNLYAHTLDWLGEHDPHPGTLVDVGCGAGQLLELCRKRGWKGIGYDPSEAAVAYARARGLEAHAQPWPPCPLADESVTAVTFVNALDHLRDPFAALQEARRILKPGGWLYVRVPNAPVQARLIQFLSPLRLDHLAVLHLFGFGREALRYHLLRLGFDPVIVRTAEPAQGDAYRQQGRLRSVLTSPLKLADRMAYRLLAGLGLAHRAWGFSVEAMASKVRPDPVGEGG